MSCFFKSDGQVDLLEKLNRYRSTIANSFMFYRPVAKMQKIIVLNAACKYLAGEIKKEELKKIMETNRHYADAFRASKTKMLMDEVLEATPFTNRTREGYVTMNRV